MVTQKFLTFIYLLQLFPVFFKCCIYSKWNDLNKTFLSYINIFSACEKLQNKDNTLRGTIPWKFLEDTEHPLPLPISVPYYIMNAWRKQVKFYSSIFWHFGDNINSIVHENIFANFIKLKNAYHVLYQLYCSGNIYYIIYSL